MTVSCPDCRSVFRVDPSKVPATGVRARCSVCGGIIVVSGGTGPMRTPVRTPVPAVSSFPTAPPMTVPARAGTPSPAPGMVGTSPPGAIIPRMATPAAAPGRIARMTPPLAPTAVQTPGAAAPFAPVPTPVPTPLPSAVPTPMPTPVPRPAAVPATSGVSSSVATATPPAVSPSVGTPRRAINPFLNADPGQRARRLARALVSDLVAYHPRKRDEGLAQGTLRQLFREEIKKSYEEYVEQVGKELAESTPHFQEALNDILAGGQRLF